MEVSLSRFMLMTFLIKRKKKKEKKAGALLSSEFDTINWSGGTVELRSAHF